MAQSSFITATSGVLVILNLFGNILVCVVILRNRNMRTPLNYLIFNLAVTDTVIGVFSIPLIVFGFISNEAEGTAALLLCKLITHGTLLIPCGIVSVFSLAAIAFGRYQAVVHPFTVREMITKKKTFVFVIVIWMLAICIAIPWYFGLDLDESVPPKCEIKSEYKNALKLSSHIFGTFTYGVILVVMIVLYGQVVRELTKKQNQIIEQNQQIAFQAKKRITMMLIIVTLIFAALWAVGTAFVTVLRFTLGNLAASVIALLILINSSINWLLYALFSKQFRIKLLQESTLQLS